MVITGSVMISFNAALRVKLVNVTLMLHNYVTCCNNLTIQL